MADRLPAFRHDGSAADAHEPLGRRLRRSLRRFVLAAGLLVVLAAGLGVWLSQADPQLAARFFVRTFVTEEDRQADRPGPDARTPTSGSQVGPPRCGLAEEALEPTEQVGILASGIVLVQHATTLPSDQLEVLRAALATHDRVLVAANPHLDASDTPIVATAWRHRMPLETPDPDLLDNFVIGYADRAPQTLPCPD